MIPASDRETSVQLIGFYVGSKFFGTDILTIREILRDPAIQPIQNAPNFIEGGVHLRGEVIPAISLVKRFGHAQTGSKPTQEWALIAHVEDRVLGFLVDSVTRILKISGDDILPAPDLIVSGMKSPYIRGICNSDLGMLVVLNMNRLLGSNELKSLKNLEMQPISFKP